MMSTFKVYVDNSDNSVLIKSWENIDDAEHHCNTLNAEFETNNEPFEAYVLDPDYRAAF